MNISIIIPNYNGEKLLAKNLPRVVEAIKDYKGGLIEVIIPDDPSTDISKEVIKQFIAGIKDENIKGKTIENKNKNLAGFSKNVTRGVSIATGEIIILLNTDVYPHKGFLEPLLKHFIDPEVFAVGCMDESLENGKVTKKGRGLGNWNRGFLIHKKGDVDKSNTLWVSGGSGAFRISTWDKLGGLDPSYDPFYWEDIDISYRALKSGYKVVFEPDSIVTHEHELGAVKKLFTENYIKKIAYRNQFNFIWKNITDASLIASHIFWLPYHFIKAFTNRDIAFFQGFFMAFFNMPNIFKKRRNVAEQFKLSDKEIIKLFNE